MRKLIGGVVIGIVGTALGAYVYVHFGFVDMAADRPVAALERFFLRGAMDRWAARSVPALTDPIPPSDAKVIDGIRLYKSNCAGCHGGPDAPVSAVGRGLYPPAPQFLKHAPDMPESQNYWIIKHGIARTGMPAWDKVLSDADAWRLAAFLGKMGTLDSLSPTAKQAWQAGATPASGTPPAPASAPAAPAAAGR